MFLSVAQLVILTLTLPLWTIFTVYLVLLLIIYLRSIKYFNYYDKCNKLNAHFAYDVEIVIGRESNNFCVSDSSIIFDLLDNHGVSVVTIQLASSSVFLESEVLSFFTFTSNQNLRKVTFSIHRKQPFKEIKSIRVAHTCNAEDSRLFIYGLRLHDRTNKEVRFFPVTSVVRNRSTQWALNTSFEAAGANDKVNFAKYGADLYDPFEDCTWPTYFELLCLLFFMWALVFYASYVLPTSLIATWPLHSLVIQVCVLVAAMAISALHIFVIKSNTYSQNNPAGKFSPLLAHAFKVTLVLGGLAFGVLALQEKETSEHEALQWISSSVFAGSILSLLVVLVYVAARFVHTTRNAKLLRARDAELARTNSKPDLFKGAFNPNRARALLLLRAKQEQQHLQAAATTTPTQTTTIAGRLSKSNSKASRGAQNTTFKSPRQKQMTATRQQGGAAGASSSNKQASSGANSANKGKTTTTPARKDRKSAEPPESKDNDMDIDNKPSLDNLYIKTKNRNSISQYV